LPRATGRPSEIASEPLVAANLGASDLKLQTTLALCAGLLVAWPAAAGTLVTTYTGYVSSGVDNAGYWGLGTGASLAGQSFTAVFTIDDQAPTSIDQDPTYSFLGGAMLGVLTINGKSRAFGTNPGSHFVSNDSTDQGLYDYATDYSQHYDADLDKLFYSSASLVGQGNGAAGAIGPDYKSPFDVSTGLNFGLQGTASFTDSSYDYATGVTTETVHWTAYLAPSRAVSTYSPDVGIPVPEPAAWALMLVGFMGAGVTIRRRRRALHA
jgi:hypothetical protein